MDVTATTQDGGVSNLAVGTWTGDGTAVTVNCGFKPRYVKLINLTDRILDEKTYDMTDAQTLHTAVDGAMTLVTTSQITFEGGQDDFRGFTVAAATNINAKVFHFIAFG